jgi:membrane-associated protease RseP (regulator of RpoE activity)
MTTKTDGKLNSVEIFTLSRDGKTLTDEETRGSSGGKVKCVFEKDSTASPASRAADQMPVKLDEQLKGFERMIGEWVLTSANSNRGLAGIHAEDLPETKRNALAKEGYDGAVIGALIPGLPAEKAGLKVGDIIIKINTVEMHSKREVMQFLNQTTPGQSITLAILRHGKVEYVALTLVQAQPVRIVTEAGPGGHSILTRGSVVAGIIYVDPMSRNVVWLNVGLGGRVHRGTYSAEALIKDEYAGSFEDAAADGQVLKGISHTRWVNRDEFVTWDTDLTINGDGLPDSPQLQFKRVQ